MPDQPMPVSYRQQWAQLLAGPHSPRRWAQIAEAIRRADDTGHDQYGAPVQRGDETWCRTALSILDSPALADAAQHWPDTLPRRCLADTDLLRAWLTAPASHADYARTVADGMHLPDWRTATPEDAHEPMLVLLARAQNAGVFGVADHRLELHRLVGGGDYHSGFLLVARPSFGPGLASGRVTDDDLIPTRARSTVDGAVRFLTYVAAITDATLDIRDAAQEDVRRAFGHSRWGRGLRSPITTGTDTPVPPAIEAPPPLRRPHGR